MSLTRKVSDFLCVEVGASDHMDTPHSNWHTDGIVHDHGCEPIVPGVSKINVGSLEG